MCQADYSVIENVVVEGSATKNNNKIQIISTNYSNIINTISSNNLVGLDMYVSNYNVIRGSDFSENSRTGIFLSINSENNEIYNNNFINNGFDLYIDGYRNIPLFKNLPEGGNYWSVFDEPSEGCNDVNSDKICDSPYHPNNGTDNYPWKIPNGWLISQNQSPTLSSLNQLKSDNQTQILENGITQEPTIVFKATLNDQDNDQVKLQIELKEFNQSFNELNLIESDFILSGSEAIIIQSDLIKSQYHWRARAVDDKGNVSNWQEFGIVENVDFEVKLVPLYTQVRSQYPPRSEEEEWADSNYAEGGIGIYPCAKNNNATIARCGCAITSIVMIARYYDITEAQGKDVNPGTINEWLKANNGYQNGDVDWIAGAKYTNERIKYEKTDKIINNLALLDEKLNNNQPVIAKAKSGRGGVDRQHFFIIDNKLTLTYGVKDPAWYNTKTLNESTDGVNKIRGYENGFDGLRIYKKGDGIAQSAITFALGSPAELLITDPQGRKLGKNQDGIEYNEIPNASYFEDGFDDPFGENSPPQERNKLIQILEPLNGTYQLQVVGTGKGSYSLSSNFYDTQNNINHQTLQSETAPDYIAQYNFSFNSSNSKDITIELFDETPPEAEIYFNPETQKLGVLGIDNTTVNPVISVVENREETIYQIKDEAGNSTKLVFEKIRLERNKIKAELKSIQYNDKPVIKLPEAEFKFEWSIDKKTNKIKKLEQKIEVEDQFEIKAKYNHRKNETKIKTETGEDKEIKQTLPGLVLVKLITKSGVLGFEF